MRTATLSILVALVMTSIATVAAASGNGIVVKQSANDVATTLDNLERIVRDKGFSVIARVDHAAGAEKAGIELRPTQVLIFGNPAVGSKLMTSRQRAALDLPIRVLAWEDASGGVWLAYHSPASIAKAHNILDRDAVVTKMTGALDKLTDAAAR